MFFIFGILIITTYYPISSKLKFIYSDIKNVYSEMENTLNI